MYLHYPIGPRIPIPSTTQHRCRGWRRCGKIRRERYCCATRTEAAGERGRGYGRCSSITQLAVISVSPARHSTVVKDGAGVDISGRERYCCATCTEAAGERGRGFARCSSITQLAVASEPQHDTAPLSRMAQVGQLPKRALLLCDPYRGCW